MTFGVSRPSISAEIEVETLNIPPIVNLASYAADVNGDGFDDLVAIGAIFTNQPNAGPQEGVVLINDKRGGFDVAPGARPTAQGPRELAVADFNDDGILDIFIAEQGLDFEPFLGGQSQLLLGNSRGGFTDATDRLPDVSDFSHSVTAGDIDGDGDIDLYVGNISGLGLIESYFLINDGTARFELNRDLLPDSVATGLAQSPPNRYLSSHLTDVNGDGALDLILGKDESGGNEANKIFFNDGVGGFSDERVLELAPKIVGGDDYSLTQDIQTLDINKDGLQDILLLQTTTFYDGWSIQMLIQQEDGSFIDEASSRLIGKTENINEQWGQFLRIADINGDGEDDIFLNFAVESGRPIFLMNTGFGSFLSVTGEDYPSIEGYLGSGDNSVILDGANIRFAETYEFEGEQLLATGRQFGRPEFEGQFTRLSENIVGDRGKDLIFASGGNDTVKGLGGADSIDGGGGKDILIGNGGKDMLRGGGGKDTLNGGGGKDQLEGGRSKDDLLGGGGADTLEGDGGKDTLNGGGGRDVLDGGRGNDILTGGRGPDTFVFGTGSAKDRVTDFQDGLDRIKITSGADSFADLTISETEGDVQIAFSNVLITLEDVPLNAITAEDFLF